MNNVFAANEFLIENKKLHKNNGYYSGDEDFFVDDTLAVFPGFCDVHVHFREPGFSYKEDIRSGSTAAAAGGYTCVCTMPNLNPVPDCPESLKIQTDIIRNNAVIDVVPYGAITIGEKGKTLSDMCGMAKNVCAFSDDGKGIQDKDVMLKALETSAKLGKVLALHEEDESLCGGVINEGRRANELNVKGISAESEYAPIMRDVELAKQTNAKIHICHVSTAQSVEVIRRAKRDGVDITCETAPHYLVLTQDDVKNEGRFKMNPPLRSKEDRAALIEGVKDGTIDMIATDHAPHGEKEKSADLCNAPFGIVGLETAFPVLYTHLVKSGIISLKKLIELISLNPRKRFNLKLNEDFTVFDIKNEYEICSKNFVSKGKSTPFDKQKVFGKCMATFYGGKVVWQENSIRK